MDRTVSVPTDEEVAVAELLAGGLADDDPVTDPTARRIAAYDEQQVGARDGLPDPPDDWPQPTERG